LRNVSAQSGSGFQPLLRKLSIRCHFSGDQAQPVLGNNLYILHKEDKL